MRASYAPVIPALESVLIMMLVGSVAALWAPLVWKADRIWLRAWLALPLEVLAVLVGSVEAASA
jgi:hypothetical protein